MDRQIEKNKAYYNTSLLDAIAFSERYELSKGSLDVAHHNKHPFVKKIAGTLYVDEKALIRRREFYKKVWNKAQENYYRINEFVPDPKLYTFLAKVLDGSANSWLQFLKYGLFSVAFNDKSILSYQISNRLWTFYRASTFIIRRLLRYETLVAQGKMRRIKSGGVKNEKHT